MMSRKHASRKIGDCHYLFNYLFRERSSLHKSDLFLYIPLFAVFVLSPLYADTIIVDCDGSGDYTTVQAGIDAATTGDEIVVLDGVYTGDGNRDIDFDGKLITVRSANGPDHTIIDCLAGPDEPHRGFYFQNNEGPESVLRGFTITGGYAPADVYYSNDWVPVGGGVCCYYSSPTIKDCRIVNNISQWHGGGVFGCYSDVRIDGCTLQENESLLGHGGAVYVARGDPIIRNCSIIRNHVYTLRGALYFKGPNGVFPVAPCFPTVINCLISENTSSQKTGGIYCYNRCHLTALNCTFANNVKATWGGGIYCDYECSALVRNCISWHNSRTDVTPNGEREIRADWSSSITVEYSNVQNGQIEYPASGNIYVDPLFFRLGDFDPGGTDWIYGDYHLLQGSPCVDAGDNSAVPVDVVVDLDGKSRFTDDPSVTDTGNGVAPVVDMGAYEYVPGEVVVLQTAVSRKTHGAAGTWDIDVGSGDIESRSVQLGTANPNELTIIADFDIPVAVLGGVDAVQTDIGTVTSVTPNADSDSSKVEINITDLSLNCQVNLSFADTGVGVVDANYPTDPAYASDSTLCIRVIVGDYDNTGTTDFTDFEAIKTANHLNGLVDSTQRARADFDCSGQPNFIDFAKVNNAGLINQTANPCPSPPIGP